MFLVILIVSIILSGLITVGYYYKSVQESFFETPSVPLYESSTTLTNHYYGFIGGPETNQVIYNLGPKNVTINTPYGTSPNWYVFGYEYSKYYAVDPFVTGTSAITPVGSPISYMSGSDSKVTFSSPKVGTGIYIKNNFKGKYGYINFNGGGCAGGFGLYLVGNPDDSNQIKQIYSYSISPISYGTQDCNTVGGSIELAPSDLNPNILQVRVNAVDVAGSPIDTTNWNGVWIKATTGGDHKISFINPRYSNLFPCEAEPGEAIMAVGISPGNTISKELLPNNQNIVKYCTKTGALWGKETPQGTFGITTTNEFYDLLVKGQSYYLNNTIGYREQAVLWYTVKEPQLKCDLKTEVLVKDPTNGSYSCEPNWNIYFSVIGGTVDLVHDTLSISTSEPICENVSSNLEKVPKLSNGECPIMGGISYLPVDSDPNFCYACVNFLPIHLGCREGTVNETEGTCDAFLPTRIINGTIVHESCTTLGPDYITVYQDDTITKCSKLPQDMCEDIGGSYNGTTCLNVTSITETVVKYETHYVTQNTPESNAEHNLITENSKDKIVEKTPLYIKIALAVLIITIFTLIIYIIAKRKKR